MIEDATQPAAHMAAIPTMATERSDVYNDKAASNIDDLFSLGQSPVLQQSQQPPPERPAHTSIAQLTEQELGALLAANSATPPPFQTIDPSALNSPAPMTDLSSTDNATTHTSPPSTFHPEDFPLFADQNHPSSLSCALTAGFPPNTHQLSFQPPSSVFSEPSLDFFSSLPTTEDVAPPPHTHQHQQHPALARAHSQPPEDVGPPHTHHHHHHHHHPHHLVLGPPSQQQSHQRYTSAPTSPTFRSHPNSHTHPAAPPVLTFHRASGHYLGEPRGARHPFPTAATGVGDGGVGGIVPHPFTQLWQRAEESSGGGGGGGGTGHPPPRHRQHQRGRSAGSGAQQQQQQQQQIGGSDWRAGSRAHPYERSGGVRRAGAGVSGRGGPTSAPTGRLGGGRAAGAGGGGGQAQPGTVGGGEEGEVEWRFARRSEASTLVLGIHGHIERLRRECEGMSEFVRRGFEDEREKGEAGRELERKRLEKRNKNFEVVELDEPLEPLPLSLPLESGLNDAPWDVPTNGRDIRGLDHGSVTALLDVYSIPFQQDMFLSQKKELFLRFIGANRALMHRVLD